MINQSINQSTFPHLPKYKLIVHNVCVVCLLSSHLFWALWLVDVPAGVAHEEGHTGFIIHLPSAVLAFIFLARRIQSFLSLVDREVQLLSTNELIVLHLLGIFLFFVFYFFVRKNPSSRDSTWIRTHVPTSEGSEVTN